MHIFIILGGVPIIIKFSTAQEAPSPLGPTRPTIASEELYHTSLARGVRLEIIIQYPDYNGRTYRNWQSVNQHSWDPWQWTMWSRRGGRVTSVFNSVL